jgi:hypothetical protein
MFTLGLPVTGWYCSGTCKEWIPKSLPPHQWGSRNLEEVRAVWCAAVAHSDTQAPYVLREQGAYRPVRKDRLELVETKCCQHSNSLLDRISCERERISKTCT